MRAIYFLALFSGLAYTQSTTAPSVPPWQTGVITPDGSCGGSTGYVCSPQVGACCSKDGQCGRSSAYCGNGCQTKAGNCYAPTTNPLGPGSLSPDGSCGGSNQYVCKGTSYGSCCSSSNFCGADTAHCGGGCQSSFGTCSTSKTSPDATCGGSSGYACTGSGFGDCCSSSGYCGNSTAFCGSGCQSSFGICSGGNLSPDGTCGGTKGYQCNGSAYGDCCSSSGYCGKDSAYCAVSNCQTKYGTCMAASSTLTTKTSTLMTKTSTATVTPSSISQDGLCGANGKTCVGSSFGGCCSAKGYCGKDVNYCAQGCQTQFSNSCQTTNIASLDGRCGANNGDFTCKGGPYDGNCCSQAGWCGYDGNHCQNYCQPKYGQCSGG